MNLIRRHGTRGVQAEPSAAIELRPIGMVRNRVRRPQVDGWERVESRIILNAALSPRMLDQLAGFSHLIVVFWLHALDEDRPRPDTLPIGNAMPGVLATRSQLRPNPIGFTAVQLVDVRAPTLTVRGLDAIDGTPVLDLKPYIPFYDSVPNAMMPEWVHGGTLTGQSRR